MSNLNKMNMKSILSGQNEGNELMGNINNEEINNIKICDESMRQTYYLINGDPHNPNSYILTLNPNDEYINNHKLCKQNECTNNEDNTNEILNDNNLLNIGGNDMSYKHYICHGNNISNMYDKNDVGYPPSNSVIQMKECESINSCMNKRKFSNEPRICTHCGRMFKYPSDLKKHEQIHTEEKKYICHNCGRCFRRQHQLSVHVRIHTGEKPYVCNTCGMAFRHDSTLTMHNRTRHQHLKPFKCEICDKQFGRLSHLRKHQKYVCATTRKVISGVEPSKDKDKFSCGRCGNIFNNEGELYNHSFTCEAFVQTNKAINNVNNSEGYSFISSGISHSYNHCEICDRMFSSNIEYEEHMLMVHNVNYNAVQGYEDQYQNNDNLFTTFDHNTNEVVVDHANNDISKYPFPLSISHNQSGFLYNEMNSNIEFQNNRSLKETNDSVANIELFINNIDGFPENCSFNKPLN